MLNSVQHPSEIYNALIRTISANSNSSLRSILMNPFGVSFSLNINTSLAQSGGS